MKSELSILKSESAPVAWHGPPARAPGARRLRGSVLGARGRRRSPGFVLMEVLVSLTILGIAVAALMRSFTISLTAIRKNEISTQACVLAESILQAAEVDPPASRKTEGNFEEEGFPRYSYTLEYQEEEIKYRNLKNSAKDADLRPLRHVRLTITYSDGRLKQFNPVEVETFLLPMERFTQRSKHENELFMEEEESGSRRRR